MGPALEVLRIAAGATLQDLGRANWRRYGVPAGGAFDRESHALANALLGNTPDSATVEMPLMGGQFRALRDLTVAIVGATCSVSVEPHAVGQGNLRVALRTGADLMVGPCTNGARAYLALGGGVEAETTLDSVSGTAVGRGDYLFAQNAKSLSGASLASSPISLNTTLIRVVAGPQRELLDIEPLLYRQFTVSLEANRKGVKLAERVESHSIELPSEPTCLGAIQVTPDGTPIILGPDGPTIGGYPKIAVVIDADLDRVAQLRPGDGVTFSLVSIEEARYFRKERAAEFSRLLSLLRLS